MNLQEIRTILDRQPDEFEVQVTSGYTHKLRKHRLTGVLVDDRYCGKAVVLGIRADAKDARVRWAFALKALVDGSKHLAGRASFSVVKEDERDSKREGRMNQAIVDAVVSDRQGWIGVSLSPNSGSVRFLEAKLQRDGVDADRLDIFHTLRDMLKAGMFKEVGWLGNAKQYSLVEKCKRTR